MSVRFTAHYLEESGAAITGTGAGTLQALTGIASGTVVTPAEESTGGGSTKSANGKNRRKKAVQTKALLKSIEREKRRRQAEQDKRDKPKPDKKPKKPVENIPDNAPGFTPEDIEWVKRVIDKPWSKPGKLSKPFKDTNNLRRIDQIARDAATARMEAAILKRQAFLRDEEEAIAQILTLMM